MVATVRLGDEEYEMEVDFCQFVGVSAKSIEITTVEEMKRFRFPSCRQPFSVHSWTS